MRIALLCSGLGHIARGHEIFADGLFRLLRNDIDITLFKGGGAPGEREFPIANIPRNSPLLDHVHVVASPRWQDAAHEQERMRVEGVTFGYGVLRLLLEGRFDVIHCLEREVCDVLYEHRHLFRRTPSILFSNGGAIPARELPRCDHVQEHTARSLAFSARNKAFLIPHGVDLEQFHPDVSTDFRKRHGIPADALVAISVGSVARTHKRMHHVIEELVPLDQWHLVVVGQESGETPDVVRLGRERLGSRVTFTKLPHDRLPEAYAAADAFVLGSLFETFGIVYIEAMAMGLPVVCTQHANQRSIVMDGIFVDMARPGALTEALRPLDRLSLKALGRKARGNAERHYDLRALKRMYLERYAAMAAAAPSLPRHTLKSRIESNVRNAFKLSARLLHGQAE